MYFTVLFHKLPIFKFPCGSLILVIGFSSIAPSPSWLPLSGIRLHLLAIITSEGSCSKQICFILTLSLTAHPTPQIMSWKNSRIEYIYIFLAHSPRYIVPVLFSTTKTRIDKYSTIWTWPVHSPYHYILILLSGTCFTYCKPEGPRK